MVEKRWKTFQAWLAFEREREKVENGNGGSPFQTPIFSRNMGVNLKDLQNPQERGAGHPEQATGSQNQQNDDLTMKQQACNHEFVNFKCIKCGLSVRQKE